MTLQRRGSHKLHTTLILKQVLPLVRCYICLLIGKYVVQVTYLKTKKVMQLAPHLTLPTKGPQKEKYDFA